MEEYSTGPRSLEAALSELHDDILEHCPLLLQVFRRVCTEIHCERTHQKASDLRPESPVKRHVLEIEQYGKGTEAVDLKGKIGVNSKKSGYVPSTYAQSSLPVRKGATYVHNSTTSDVRSGSRNSNNSSIHENEHSTRGRGLNMTNNHNNNNNSSYNNGNTSNYNENRSTSRGRSGFVQQEWQT